MQQSTKRFIIIVLTAVFLSFLNTKTAFAFPGAITRWVGAGTTAFDDVFNVIHTGLIYNDERSEEGETNAGTPVAQNTAIPLSEVITSTPDEDGIIIHTVKYGETLFTIAKAYGVPIDQILTNSGLSLTTTDLRERQTLVIQTATEPTATPSPTATIDPGTPTPTQIRPTITPFPTRTPAPTTTPTKPPSIIHRALGNAKYFGLGLILISALGLILVIYWGFLKKS